MDDKLRNEVDQDDEALDAAEDRGPLGRLLEHSIDAGTAEPEAAPQTLNAPSQSKAVSSDYAAGTREHDDDREG